MHQLKHLVPYILCIAVTVAFMTSTKATLDTEREINDIRYQIQTEATQSLTAALEEQGNQISALQSKIDEREVDPELPLPPDLQLHSQSVCKAYELPLDTVYAVMYHESRMLPDVPDNINRNETRDRGLMQINEVNWPWLSDLGFDVNDPKDNIAAGCYLLSMHTRKYGLQDGLRAYAVGESGMLAGGGYWFLDELGVMA